MQSYTGSCLCGGIAFEVRSPLAPIQVCHCQQCRKAQGAPFATNTPVEEAAFELLSGRELITEYQSSPGKFRAFCGRCGSPVYSRKADLSGVLRIRAGLFNEPLEARPVFHAYTGSKANWWPILDDLPRFAEAWKPEPTLR
ncbi:MAG: GFA family protein [Alcanivorax sp.]